MQKPRCTPAKSSLAPPRRRLVEWMQRICFGRIEGLVIRNGEPVLEPRPRCVKEVKFGGENGPHRKADAVDFLLKSQVLELFSSFDAVSNGTAVTIEIKHGLPFRMIYEDSTA